MVWAAGLDSDGLLVKRRRGSGQGGAAMVEVVGLLVTQPRKRPAILGVMTTVLGGDDRIRDLRRGLGKENHGIRIWWRFWGVC